MHDAIKTNSLAVITGAADGIGLATARRLLSLGMRVVLIDNDSDKLSIAKEAIGGSSETIISRHVDVSNRVEFDQTVSDLINAFGAPTVLMNNAAIADGGDILADPKRWERLIEVNLMGMVYGLNAFLPAMIASEERSLIINTGSKQGITQPPGNTAYNVAKSAVKSLTEGVAHTLREKTGDRITAHLLIPGFTYTGMMKRHFSERPAAAWTAEQVCDYMLEAIGRGDFYIICPDNETTAELDARRIAWAAGDLLENRPALSRWHPDFKEQYEAFMRD